jgi:hypothetical protein
MQLHLLVASKRNERNMLVARHRTKIVFISVMRFLVDAMFSAGD